MNKSSLIKFILAIVPASVVVVILSVPSTVFAQTDFGVNEIQNQTELGGANLITIITRIINVFLGLLGIIALVLIVYGGYKWMTAGGNEEQVTEAKRILINATIGLAIILSSFAIANFVLSQFSQATQQGPIGTGPGGGPGCANPPCTSIGGGGPQCDPNKVFYVQSITPSTEQNDQKSTHSKDVKIRAVFSQPPSQNSLPTSSQDWMTIKKDGSGITGNFNISLKQDRHVMVAEGSILDSGDYSVSVNKDIKGSNGGVMGNNNCGETQASFRVSQSPQTNQLKANDNTDPTLRDFKIGGTTPSKNNAVYEGDKLRLNLTVDDRTSTPGNYGGNAFVDLKFYNANTNQVVSTTELQNNYVGPSINHGSSDPFNFNFEVWLRTEDFATGTKYRAELTAHDIDGNQSSTSTNFTVYPSWCQNPSNTNTKGCPAGIGGSCTNNSDCKVGLKCINNTCSARPIITSISPTSGAKGTWVTIKGKYFGNTQGSTTIYMAPRKGNSGDADTAPSSMTIMPEAQCSTDTWNDSWILARVPSAVSQNEDYAIVLNNSKTGFTETTVDDNCSKSGSFATCESWFEVNNVSRPGICEVTEKNTGNNSAVPGADLSVDGRGFQSGNTNAFFNTSTIQESTTNVSSTQFDTTLPQFQPQSVEIWTTVQGIKSNSVPFRVVSTSSAQAPTLDSIDPTSTTKESYVSIFGSNFGSQTNEVWMHPQASEVRSCFSNNKPNNCVQLNANLPQQCGETWQNDQIIVQVPSGSYSTGLYNIAVQDAFGNITDGQDTLEIVSGAPKPSLCNLSPDSGPAPLASGAPPLSIHGANIETAPTPTLYFWQQGASAGSVTSSWIEAENTSPANTTVTGTLNSNKINTRLPTTTNGSSMQSGPIKLQNRSSGQISNGVRYSVQDCRDATQSTKNDMSNQGYRCCESGPEAGIWKTQNQLCEGQSRDAGYAWRFATADVPKLPVVKEQCTQNSIPSPSPRPPTSSARGLDQGKKNVCINASVQVSFNATMDPTTINSSSVQLLECGGGANEIDCSNSTSSQDNIQYILQNINQNRDSLQANLNSGGKKLTVLENINGINNPKLKSGTWYRVELSDNIFSSSSEAKAGRVVTSSYPLQITRPCGDGTAYCFEFRTSDSGETCNLDNAAISPPNYTAEELGPLMSPYDTRLWYEVVGKADQACTVINTEDFDWDWGQFLSGTSNSANQFVSTSPSTTDNLAEAFVHENTSRIVDITAATSVTTSDPGQPVKKETVEATSRLNISLGIPRVSKVWPTRSCVASCPNAPVGAKFTRDMVGDVQGKKGSYDIGNNIIVERCDDGELCANNTQVTMQPDQHLPVNKNQFNIRKQSGSFQTSTWYKVTLEGGDDGLKAIGGFDQGSPIPGKSLVTTTWKFKTKDSMQGCRLNSVDISPSPYFADTVGGKQTFRTIPRGSPNECNPKGQVLNPSNYDWNWKSENNDIVSTTNFSISDQISPFCRQDTCLLQGSELTSTSTPVCGNGKVEAGEDCDIGDSNLNETPGVSCSFDCLRPGNTDSGTSTNQCGNEKVEWQQGEECELIPAPNTPPTSTQYIKMKYINSNGQLTTITTTNPVQNASNYCNPTTCLNKGSVLPNNKPTGANTNDVPVCYSGDITPGEDCDPTTNSNEDTPGCSDSCLNQGTELSENWCKNNNVFTSKPSNLSLQKATSTKRACRNSVSICGNGNLEPSEECEVNFRQNQDDQLIFRTDKNNTSTVTTTGHSTCNESCLLTNICADKFKDLSDKVNQGTVNSGFAIRCNPNEPDCTSACRLKGSSIAYPKSSICGDGKVGAGEYPQCEVSQTQIENVFGSPVQVGTAIGTGEVKGDVKVQSTTILATTSESREGSLDITARGEGDYNLQCGFEEFDKIRTGVSSGGMKYNDCSVDSSKNRYKHGVANNSCCYVRPQVNKVYPDRNKQKVCRNTQISVKFPAYIDRTSLEDNIIIARKESGLSCDQNERNISTSTNKALAIKNIKKKTSNQEQRGFWQNVWFNIKSFFSGVTNKVFAATFSTPTWCQGGVEANPKVIRTFSTQDDSVTTTIRLQLDKPLAANSTYAIILESRNENGSGITDNRGVSIMGSSNLKDSLNVAWEFTTGDEICKVDSVDVEPDSYLYKQPNTSTVFEGVAKDDDGENIQPTSFYDWKNDWGPTANPAFEVPNVTSTDIAVTSTAEGEMKLRGSVVITEDKSKQGAQPVGKKFSDQSSLTANYCRIPWPTSTVENWEPYTNNQYNFSFDYCSDDGDDISTADDLPLLEKGPTTTQLKLFKSKDDLKGSLNTSNAISISKLEIQENILVTANGSNIRTFNTSDKRNPELVVSTSTNNVSVGAMAINGSYLYIFDSGTNKEVEIYEIDGRGGLTFIDSKSVNNSSNFSAQVAEASGNNIFVGTGSGVFVIDVTTSIDPEFDQTKLSGSIQELDLQNNKLAALESNAVSVFNINDLNRNDTQTQSINSPKDVALAGDTLAVLNKNNIQLFDAENYTDVISTISTSSIGSNVGKITAINENLVIPNPNAGSNGVLKVFDISSPFRFRAMFDDNTSFPVYSHVQSQDEYAYFYTPNSKNLQIANISDSSNPKIPLPSVRRSILDKKLFLNDKNEDAIGVQVFQNPDKKGVMRWYRDNFGNPSGFRSIEVDGYSGLTNGTEYYISALNAVSSTQNNNYDLYHNIYNFNINRNASEKSQKILDRIIDNLTFNINMNEASNQCLDNSAVSPSSWGSGKWVVRDQSQLNQTVDIRCNNDFQCRDSQGIARLAETEELIASSTQVINYPGFDQIISNNSTNTNTAKTNISAVTSTLNSLVDSIQKDYNSLSNKQNNIESSLPVNSGMSTPQNFSWLSGQLPQDSNVRAALISVSNTTKNNLNWTNGYCANIKDKLKRDWKRLRDIGTIQEQLEDGAVPMDSGSYVPHYTNSNWPSWQTLSRRAGSPGFPVDPVNKMVGCSEKAGDPNDIDPATCWNPVSSTFHYPKFSKMYEYRYNTSTEDYKLHTDLEFLKAR